MSFVTTVGVLWLGFCLLLLLGLAELADEVLEQESFLLDEATLLWINQFTHPWLDRVMLAATRLGDPSTVVPLACIGFSLLLWRREWRVATLFAIACTGGAVLSIGLKLFFSKPRPQLWPQLITEHTYSFPSGHALGSMVLYGFSSYLLVQYFPQWRGLIYGLATLLIGAIGLSRIYLGVHWPTDVLAGYAIGFLWISGCIALLKLKQVQRAS
ncbi:phosphatase PAP2 family protein [Nodosilinea sp. E11]|uniref:phosphatase PAP2 family protein n=1 Tax=Nodosilinea sp. E11 TaxID=3037479 RepID=UPI0029340FCD|nr:phosphatase PAP2 family protein [Nodosilinea sp. E11]WOD40221.1 phosphatase PAP2 family protein [Nodosilinea sp. E11]